MLCDVDAYWVVIGRRFLHDSYWVVFVASCSKLSHVHFDSVWHVRVARPFEAVPSPRASVRVEIHSETAVKKRKIGFTPGQVLTGTVKPRLSSGCE